ncbi:hypothetical protein [Celeribacter persicus]|uniref:hypothetical protein n=1 Tax=Celeribacter persicus TaxID=1651082 RepID=UPI000D30C048|nr:hypothetical protein [Celeribacter persicus]
MICDPRIIQGFLTFSAALVAAGTALWIAYKAYPKQKSEDHKLQIRADKRKAYSEFFTAYIQLYRTAGTDDFKEAERAARLTFNAIVLYAPKDVVLACRKLLFAVRNLNDKICDGIDEVTFSGLSIECKETEVSAMTLARSDAHPDDLLSEDEMSMLLYGPRPKKEPNQ